MLSFAPRSSRLSLPGFLPNHPFSGIVPLRALSVSLAHLGRVLAVLISTESGLDEENMLHPCHIDRECMVSVWFCGRRTNARKARCFHEVIHGSM